MNKLFLSEAISVAVRDFLKIVIILGVKLVLTKIILETICQIYISTISDMLLTKSFLYYQQGSKYFIGSQYGLGEIIVTAMPRLIPYLGVGFQINSIVFKRKQDFHHLRMCGTWTSFHHGNKGVKSNLC